MSIILIPVNPVPWTPSRSTRQGSFKTGGLDAYQQAVKEELDGIVLEEEPPFDVHFYFWRQLEAGEAFMSGRSKRRGHQADATNMQKSTEDALQKILGNDRDVYHVESTIVDQGPDVEGMVIIQIGHFQAPVVPLVIQDLREANLPGQEPYQALTDYEPRSNLF